LKKAVLLDNFLLVENKNIILWSYLWFNFELFTPKTNQIQKHPKIVLLTILFILSGVI